MIWPYFAGGNDTPYIITTKHGKFRTPSFFSGEKFKRRENLGMSNHNKWHVRHRLRLRTFSFRLKRRANHSSTWAAKFYRFGFRSPVRWGNSPDPRSDEADWRSDRTTLSKVKLPRNIVLRRPGLGDLRGRYDHAFVHGGSHRESREASEKPEPRIRFRWYWIESMSTIEEVTKSPIWRHNFLQDL